MGVCLCVRALWSRVGSRERKKDSSAGVINISDHTPRRIKANCVSEQPNGTKPADSISWGCPGTEQTEGKEVGLSTGLELEKQLRLQHHGQRLQNTTTTWNISHTSIPSTSNVTAAYTLPTLPCASLLPEAALDKDWSGPFQHHSDVENSPQWAIFRRFHMHTHSDAAFCAWLSMNYRDVRVTVRVPPTVSCR